MKFELKTENENNSKLFPNLLSIFFIFALIIVLCDIAIKLGNVSKYYQVEYNCRLLSVEKSKNKFKKLSRLSNLKSKQLIWELCKDIIK